MNDSEILVQCQDILNADAEDYEKIKALYMAVSLRAMDRQLGPHTFRYRNAPHLPPFGS